MTEASERLRVVEEAERWIGTRYRDGQGVLGAGVDCAYLLVRVFERAGLLRETIHIPPYKGALARQLAGEKLYLSLVSRFARRVDREPKTADIVIFDIPISFRGRGTTRATHGAIVASWPQVIHAHLGRGVVRDKVGEPPLIGGNVNSVWTLEGWT
jgi:cell wall-associated NlpC family hydrolase